MGLMRTYFTVAQAMQRLASRGRLRARFTEGRAWFAIETPDAVAGGTVQAVYYWARYVFYTKTHKARVSVEESSVARKRVWTYERPPRRTSAATRPHFFFSENIFS